VLISAAAGAVGSIAGQIAKLKGARAVGIAGGEAKSRQVVERFGYDACIDYKSGDVRKGIAQHCPDGVDVYFDNVGGPVLQAALFQMRQHGRIVCCGAVSGYDAGALPAGPMGVPGLLVVRRIRMEGFIVMDQPPEVIAEAQKSLETWVREGKIAVAEDIVDGLENAPRALIGLLAGDNVGKRIVRVS
jgi:NADPH-dependent curcumin reductase CurA